MSETRLDWHSYFLSIAKQVAARSTCQRKHVGVVLVNDNKHILSTGYNGSVKHLEHCTDVGCLMLDGHCARTIHAEANAICQAAANGVSLSGATAYITVSPCWNCYKLLVNAGIKEIFTGESYSHANHNIIVCESAKLTGVNVNTI